MSSEKEWRALITNKLFIYLLRIYPIRIFFTVRGLRDGSHDCALTDTQSTQTYLHLSLSNIYSFSFALGICSIFVATIYVWRERMNKRLVCILCVHMYRCSYVYILPLLVWRFFCLLLMAVCVLHTQHMDSRLKHIFRER